MKIRLSGGIFDGDTINPSRDWVEKQDPGIWVATGCTDSAPMEQLYCDTGDYVDGSAVWAAVGDYRFFGEAEGEK